MNFCGLAKTSTLDFPGMLAAVLFSPGCNYDCFYCHNRALLGGETPLLVMDEVMRFLEKRRGLIDGLVLTGGEVTLQEGIAEFIEIAREMGYRVKLDTNGSRPGVVRELVQKRLLHYVALDYKAPFDRYEEICGPLAHPEMVMETFDVLLFAGIDFELRTTVIPQLSLEELIAMARALPAVPRYVLQNYRTPEVYRPEDRFRIAQRPYEDAFLARAAKEIRAFQPGCVVR